MRYYLELTLATIIATTIAVLLPVILMVVSRVKIAPSKRVLLHSGFFLFVVLLLIVGVVRLFIIMFKLSI